jgi:hypothetical protein
VPFPRSKFDLARVLTLQEVRSFIRQSRSRVGVAFFGLVYLLGALLGGGMLTLFALRGGYTVEILLGSGTGQGWWNYPGLLVLAPWGVLVLPFLSTLVMLVVAVGVGLGMTVAVVLAYRLLRPTPEEVARSKAVGVVTGLTPAMVGLVTLGACCSTTTAATAGVGLVAAASGTTVTNLILNNWVLGLFQLAVVWVALIAQELLLTVYGGLYRGTGRTGATAIVAAPALGLRYFAGIALRVALIVGGLLWALAIFAQWPSSPPGSAGAGLWFQWIAQHELLGILAVVAGLFPGAVEALLRRTRTGLARVVPAALVVAGLSLLVWLPSALTASGVDSLADQILGSVGVGAAWGGLSPGPVTGISLAARWICEYLLLGGFAVSAAIAPRATMSPLLATLPRPVSLSVGPGDRASSRPELVTLPWVSAGDAAGGALEPFGSSTATSGGTRSG